MDNLTVLKKAAYFSDERTNSSKVSVENFVTTDSILQNKTGIKLSDVYPNGNLIAFAKGDILVGNIRPYLKKIWFADRKGGCSPDVLVFKSKQGFDSKFIYYSLFRDDFFNHMMKGSKGTKMPRGDKNQILDFLIPSFDLSNQQKIAAVLSALDSKIELNKRINAELEAMAKTLYDYWFVQFDFPDEAGKPYKTSGGKMVWNAELKREIPDGWEVEKLDDVVELILDHRGKTPLKLGGDWTNKGEGVIALSAKHVKSGQLVNLNQANRVSLEMYEKWMPEKLKDGDILMTSEAPLGEFYFLLNETKFCMSQRLFGIRADKSKVFPSYLYFELSKGNGFSQIIGSQSGSTVFGIRQDELRKIKILKPNLIVQTSFDEIALPMLSQIRFLVSQNQQLAELRDWLLPMLMNGQVSVAEISKKPEAQPAMAAFATVARGNTKQIDSYRKIQILYATIAANKNINVKQGEMATAKDVYLLDRVSGVNTNFNFARHNWGAFDPQEKALLNTKQYFHKPNFPNSRAYYLDLKDNGSLLEKIPAELKRQISTGINEMNDKVFGKYSGKQKAAMKELYATILKCIEDKQSLSLKEIRAEMASWKIKQGETEMTKAEKFSEAETQEALSVIINENWYKNVFANI